MPSSFLLNRFRKFLSKKSQVPAAECKSSRERSCNSSTTTTAGGPLDTNHQLVEAYGNLFKRQGVEEAWKTDFFQRVRILVIGRSSAGKSTLIRFMVGKDGPQTISNGVAGVQDIDKGFEYFSAEEGVSITIHDTNGIDVEGGKERKDAIEKFLQTHQKSADFSNRIHIVWYVVSAMERRIVDDGGLMEMIGHFKIPVLLVMTHNDFPVKFVTDADLDRLLEKYGTEEERAGTRTSIVKVGNAGVSFGPNEEVTIDESRADEQGLKLVAEKTRQLLDKRLKYTWITAQAVDVHAKLELSAGLIAGYARGALLTSLIRVPVVDSIKLSLIFYRTLVVLCQIWAVPKELKEALMATLMREGSCYVLKRMGKEMLKFVVLVVAAGGTILTGVTGLVSIPLAFALAASGFLSIRNAVPILVKTFSLQVLGTILYAKSMQAGSMSKNEWNSAVTEKEYVKLCHDFNGSHQYQSSLKNFVKEYHSMLDTAVRKKKVKALIRSKVVEIYRLLLLPRDGPHSLSALPSSSSTRIHVDIDVPVQIGPEPTIFGSCRVTMPSPMSSVHAHNPLSHNLTGLILSTKTLKMMRLTSWMDYGYIYN